MKPEISLPRVARRPVAIAVPVLFAVWALAGYYGALAPSITAGLVHSHSVVYGGLGLSLLAAAGALSVLVLRNTPTRTVMLFGVLALIVGVALTVVSIGSGTGGTASVIGFFAGTAVAGFGFGAGFQGGIRMVMPLVEAHQRAGVLSLLYVVSYLGMGVPAVVGGVLVVHGGGLLETSREYGAAVIVLAAAALVGLLVSGRRAQQAAPGLVVAGSGPVAEPGAVRDGVPGAATASLASAVSAASAVSSVPSSEVAWETVTAGTASGVRTAETERRTADER